MNGVVRVRPYENAGNFRSPGDTLKRLAGATAFIGAILFIAGCGQGQNGGDSGIDSGERNSGDRNSGQVAGLVPEGFRGRVVAAGDVTEATVADWKRAGWTAIVLFVGDESNVDQLAKAASHVTAAGFSVEYFFEIARCEELAEAHPEWMGSIQGHDEWRRLYPELRSLNPGEVVKVWPWVPILYRESFDAHMARLDNWLRKLPAAQRVWLHDLQGAPSACGCGHPLCRWTSDYGKIRTATMLDDRAAADFLKEIETRFPETNFVPLWVTECEAADEHEACGGVGCFEGLCWKKWAVQLEHVALDHPVIAASCFYKAHFRDLGRYGDEAAWVTAAVGLFEAIPGQFDGAGVENSRIVAALQGWDVSDAEVEAQFSAANEAGARGSLLVTTRIEQSWKPVILDIASKKVVDAPLP